MPSDRCTPVCCHHASVVSSLKHGRPQLARAAADARLPPHGQAETCLLPCLPGLGRSAFTGNDSNFTRQAHCYLPDLARGWVVLSESMNSPSVCCTGQDNPGLEEYRAARFSLYATWDACSKELILCFKVRIAHIYYRNRSYAHKALLEV